MLVAAIATNPSENWRARTDQDLGDPLRGDGSGEIKRMFVAGAARGRGIARALLTAIDARAGALGLRTLQLETGPRQLGAIALYKATGYRVVPNFGQYIGDEFSVCMEKSLG